MNYKYVVIILTFFCSSITLLSRAQHAGLEVDFFGYADNREYKSLYTKDKTFFGSILTPQLYFALDSNHRIYGGLHYNQDFGRHSENRERLSPIAYYNFNNKNIDFALGLFPRHKRLADIPRMVLADTLLYDRPNMEGMYFSFQNKNIKQAIYIDWMSQQSYRHRERFVVGLSGKYTFGKFYMADDALLYHNALTSNPEIEEHIQDNGIVIVRAGVDLSHTTFLDTLTADAGVAFGFDRVRTEYDLRTARGFIANVHLGYRSFFLHNTLYLGEAQNLPNGDSFYHRDTYNRLDLGWTPFKKGNVDGKVTASFHFAPDQVSNQQAFTLRYRFGKAF